MRRLLETYGVHGLLMAGATLCGKLARRVLPALLPSPPPLPLQRARAPVPRTLLATARRARSLTTACNPIPIHCTDRYSYFDDLHLRLEACRLGATLLAGVCAASVAHPQRAVDFATYTPRVLYDGQDLFADGYRCSLADVLSGVETVSTVLVDSGLPLAVLPAIALWEHVALYVARTVPGTALCRTLRARALVQLGLLADAAGVLGGLMAAADLPSPAFDSPLVVRAADGAPIPQPRPPPFDSRLPPGAAPNVACAAFIAENALHEAVAALYGPWLAAQLANARAEFLLQLASVREFWRGTDRLTGEPRTAPPPEAVEGRLLDQAAGLLGAVCGWTHTAYGGAGAAGGAAGGSPDKGGKPPAKGKPDPKAAARPASAAPPRLQELAKPSAEAGPVSQEAKLVYVQRAEATFRALTLLARVEVLRWKPAAGLAHAAAAVRLVADAASFLDSSLGSNDELERWAMDPLTWLQARLTLVTLSQRLGHAGATLAQIEGALADCASVGDTHVALQLVAVRAAVLDGQGHAAEALNAYGDALGRAAKLALPADALGALRLELGDVQSRLGLHAEAAASWAAAHEALAAAADELGFAEMREYPERHSIYVAAVTQLCASALRAGQGAALLGRLGAATSALDAGAAALPFSRALPPLTAAMALMRARVARHVAVQAAAAASSDADGDAGLAAAAAECRTLLVYALNVAVLDGGHDARLVRGAQLELASWAALLQDAPGAAAALAAAHGVATKLDVLMHAAHTLVPVPAAAVPDWLAAVLKGQERYGATASGRLKAGEPEPALSEADLGRLAVCHLANLVRSEGHCGLAEKPALLSQMMALQAALRAGCPKYAADCCFAAVPLPPAAPPPVAAGAVLVQWYGDDVGLYPGSAPARALPAAGITHADVLAVPAPPGNAVLLYVVAPGAGQPLVGQLLFERSQLLQAQREAGEVRRRLEAPRAPTDLYGPEPAEDHETVAALQRLQLFLKRRLNKPADWGSVTLGAGRSDSPTLTVERADPELARSAAFWAKAEAMLAADTGVAIAGDAAFAAWLAGVLPCE